MTRKTMNEYALMKPSISFHLCVNPTAKSLCSSPRSELTRTNTTNHGQRAGCCLTDAIGSIVTPACAEWIGELSSGQDDKSTCLGATPSYVPELCLSNVTADNYSPSTCRDLFSLQIDDSTVVVSQTDSGSTFPQHLEL